MKIGITGASGLVGTALTNVLARRGHDVVRFVRRASSGPNERSWRPSEQVLEAEALADLDAIVHLAGAGIADKPWNEERKQVIYDSRIESTRLIVERLRELDAAQRPAAFLCASAIGYYGDRGDERLHEGSGVGEGFLANVCADWEAEAIQANALGVRTALMRTGIVLDKDDGALGQMLLPFKLGVGGKLGDGRQYMSWVSIADTVGAYVFVLESDSIAGPVNLTAPNPETNREFTKTLGRVLNRPTFMSVPAFGVKALFGEMGEKLLLEGSRVFPTRLLDAGYSFRFVDLEDCLRDLLE